MEFTPKSEMEIRQSLLMPEGDYDFKVDGADDKVSKGGNEMIALRLTVWDHDGNEHKMRDWLVSSDHALCQMKIRHFCEATGLMHCYESGNLDSLACLNATGRVSIGSKEDPTYGPQNTIQDYLSEEADVVQDKPAMPSAGQTKRANEAFPTDEIPF